MSEKANAITFKGSGLTLVGNQVTVGQKAPDFTAVADDMSAATFSTYRGQGKVVIISSVPSLDTPVCDTQTRRFNEESAKLGDDVTVLTISVDLPMAQKRWCGAVSATNITTLSDYKDHQFGQAYGLYIKELGLLARAVLVVDKTGSITHYDLVSEVTHEPDYAAAISAAKVALSL